MSILNSFSPSGIKTFFAEARHEFRHINWPTRSELVYLTSVVIILSLALAIFLGIFDAIFVAILGGLIGT